MRRGQRFEVGAVPAVAAESSPLLDEQHIEIRRPTEYAIEEAEQKSARDLGPAVLNTSMNEKARRGEHRDMQHMRYWRRVHRLLQAGLLGYLVYVTVVQDRRSLTDAPRVGTASATNGTFATALLLKYCPGDRVIVQRHRDSFGDPRVLLVLALVTVSLFEVVKAFAGGVLGNKAAQMQSSSADGGADEGAEGEGGGDGGGEGEEGGDGEEDANDDVEGGAEEGKGEDRGEEGDGNGDDAEDEGAVNGTHGGGDGDVSADAEDGGEEGGNGEVGGEVGGGEADEGGEEEGAAVAEAAPAAQADDAKQKDEAQRKREEVRALDDAVGSDILTLYGRTKIASLEDKLKELSDKAAVNAKEAKDDARRIDRLAFAALYFLIAIMVVVFQLFPFYAEMQDVSLVCTLSRVVLVPLYKPLAVPMWGALVTVLSFVHWEEERRTPPREVQLTSIKLTAGGGDAEPVWGMKQTDAQKAHVGGEKEWLKKRPFK
eukprot:g4225.t1